MSEQMKNKTRASLLCSTAFFYGIAGICGGVFYREFTKLHGFTGETTLAYLHVHLFVLGMLFSLVAMLTECRFRLSEDKDFKRFYLFYNIGVISAVAMLTVRGLTQVLGLTVTRGLDASISGLSGIAHIILTVGLVQFFLLLKRKLD